MKKDYNGKWITKLDYTGLTDGLFELAPRWVHITNLGNAPICEIAAKEIEASPAQYPWQEYATGFFEFTPNFRSDKALTSAALKEYWLPAINQQTGEFCPFKARELGQLMAEKYYAWQAITKDVSHFDSLMIIEPITITEKGIPSPYTKEELMRIFDVMHNKGWVQGYREHFAAIFSNKPLIECNGWKPVTYCKTSRKAGNKANDAFIGALVAILSPDEPNKIISPNLFQFNGKPLNIGKNNRQTKTAEGEVEKVLNEANVKKR